MKKMVAYNMTFCEYKDNARVLCVLSHSGEIEKNANEFFNLYLKFLTSEICENATKVILKSDNCVGQNKNRLLLGNLIYLVNDIIFKPQILEMDFLEVGHTHMPTDTVHGHSN